MNAMNLNVISVRYKSGIDGLGSYPSGQIIFAYLIESTKDSEFRFIYHPKEEGMHDVHPSIDVCKYNATDDYYEPIDSYIYINLL